MNELIRVTERHIGDGTIQTIQTVNARDLHAFLGSKRQFADWISERIQKYGFVENQDFAIASQNCDAKSPGQRGGHNKKEFFLTLDMAKELAMVENNDKGREARLYFIDCERRAKAKVSDLHAALADPAKLRTMLLTYTEKVMVLEAKVQEQAPKVAFVDKYVAGNGNKTFREVAKLLQIKEYKFREFLESNRIMYKLNGEWTVYQNHVDAKRFHVKTGVSDSGHVFNHALFTPKGIDWIAGELAKFNLRGAA